MFLLARGIWFCGETQETYVHLTFLFIYLFIYLCISNELYTGAFWLMNYIIMRQEMIDEVSYFI